MTVEVGALRNQPWSSGARLLGRMHACIASMNWASALPREVAIGDGIKAETLCLDIKDMPNQLGTDYTTHP
jgi:hypothetical protein